MNLGNKLKTHQNALKFKSYLEDIRLILSKDKRKNVESVLEEDNELAKIVLNLVKSSDAEPTDPSSIIEFLDKLIHQVDSLEKIDLTIAVEPTEDLVRDISDWVQKEVKDNVLIDIEVDPEALGGIKLSYKGNYIDLSLDKRLKETFENKEVNLK